MLFNSTEFLFFLPIVFCLYWLTKERKLQNLIILLASYVFYGWWDWRFLFLIVFTSLCSFFSGIWIERSEGRRHQQKIISATNIVANLFILGVFKYYNFFVDSLSIVLEALFHYQLNGLTLNIILPVGISFYTFQALSYSIDVYQKKLPATRDLIEFSAYISFFPQLVAGPIERATNLLPQFQQNRRFDYAKAVDGCRQMLWGFMKKILIADNCAAVVNEHWANYQGYSGLTLLLVAILFTFQIYCDFSGYSDIAIGCARLFGFNLMRNFNFPYFSRSIPEFWRRWHISLTTWFRDYIYFPLGGSRCDKAKVIRNIFIVWTISGLWHGASWHFVCWGIYHATLLAIYNILCISTKYKNVVASKRYLPNLKETAQMSLTFLLTVFGWILFRAESMPQAFDYFMCMITHPGSTHKDLNHLVLLATIPFIIEWIQRDKQHALQFPDSKIFRSRLVRWVIYLSILLATYVSYLLNIEDDNTFIYFQF